MDLVYPRRCPICDKIVDSSKVLACNACLKKLEKVKEPKCLQCGKSLGVEEQALCLDCEKEPKSYEKGYPVFHYTKEMKESMGRFKYHNKREYGDFYVLELLKSHEENLRRLKLDGIVPVPMYRKKQRIRGYNQAALLGKKLSEALGIPCYSDYILREVDTIPQKDLNDKERMKNVKNAFKIGENKVQLKKVLLVDDIYTSGATIEACTRVLLAAGTQKVYYTSICIGKGY